MNRCAIDLKNFNRARLLRAAVCAAFLAGILFSRRLWFPLEREFPRAPPLFDLPENLHASAEWLFSAALVGALIFLNFARRSRIFSLSAIGSLVCLIALDQTRLQPWVYQYALLLLIFAARDFEKSDEAASNQTLGLAQIIIAGLYVWSGIQKMNFTFSHETLPLLLAPVQNAFPTVELPLIYLGSSIALTEVFVGCGLLVRRTRNFAVCAAIAMHAVILGLLIAKNFNSIVWIWNAALMLLVFVCFWRSDVSIKQTFAARRTENRSAKAAKLLTAAAVLLPVLSFWGWWDLYLSGALYSGNTPTAVVRIDADVLERLPAAARRNVFEMKSGERILPLFEWAMTDLNVPVYPESRVFKRAARAVCGTGADKSRVELIIKERPAIFDGSYKLTRIDCAQLERDP